MKAKGAESKAKAGFSAFFLFFVSCVFFPGPSYQKLQLWLDTLILEPKKGQTSSGNEMEKAQGVINDPSDTSLLKKEKTSTKWSRSCSHVELLQKKDRLFGDGVRGSCASSQSERWAVKKSRSRIVLNSTYPRLKPRLYYFESELNPTPLTAHS